MRKYRQRIYYTEADKTLMWDRWQKGESLHTIAHLFDRTHGSVRRILAETGGIRPTPRKRSRLALTLSEREEISRGIDRNIFETPVEELKETQVNLTVVGGEVVFNRN
jgi:hypothetical protein